MSRPLYGKTALVTGCRRGIGKAAALALAGAGADVIGVSSSLDVSDEVGAEITAEAVDSAPTAVTSATGRLSSGSPRRC